MAVPSVKRQQLINTTGTAVVATTKNEFRGKIISTEVPISMPKGTIVEQVGDPVDFMGVMYFYDAKGMLYNSKDFMYYLPEVNLTPATILPEPNQIKPQNNNSNGSFFWWIIGGIALYSVFNKK